MKKKRLKVRKKIRDRDNHGIKKAIARMSGGAMPSGTNFSIFLDRVIYELYVEKDGLVDEGTAEIDDIGGSVAKASKPSNYVIDDSSKATGDRGDDSNSDSGLSAHGKQLRKEGGDRNAAIMNDDEEDEEHREPRASINFVPANLLVILITGVLSNKCEPCITHVCEPYKSTISK